MKKIATILALAGAASAYGQGQLALDNFTKALIPIYKDGGVDKLGVGYSAAVFVGATQIGADIPFQANGRFNGGAQAVAGVAAGKTAAGVTVRAWDTSQGTYDKATAKGVSAAFTSQPLGGVDADGNPVLTPKLVGLASFNIAAGGTVPGPVQPGPAQPGAMSTVPEPSTIALGALGAVALMLRRRK